MADLKAPLLPLGKHGDSPQQMPKRTRVYFEHPVVVCISRTLIVFSLALLVYTNWPRLSSSWRHMPNEPPKAIGSNTGTVQHDPALNYTRRELVHFDIAEPAYAPIGRSLSISEYLGICHYSYAWNATGTIKLVPGDPDQHYNFMVLMDVSASSQMAVDSVVWPIDSDSHGMYIRCVEFPKEASTDWDATIRVDVTVFVKPNSLHFGEFRVGAGILDVEIAEGLAFETYHMSLSSAGGSIRGVETEKFTAHEISAVSINGSITGNWSLPGRIHLQTGGWNSLHKPIDIDIIPKMGSSGPATQGILSATTQGGDIDIRMPLKENLSMRNMSIDIQSQLGSISGTFVTGYITSLSTLSGSIDATLLPYFALPDTSTLITRTSAEDTTIRVLPPIIDNYYQVNPLKNTKSDHSTTSGTLKLRYPKQWVGAALGLSETGSVTIQGDRFNTILQEDHLVVARTEDEIASRLDFSTTTGDGYLVVE